MRNLLKVLEDHWFGVLMSLFVLFMLAGLVRDSLKPAEDSLAQQIRAFEIRK